MMWGAQKIGSKFLVAILGCTPSQYLVSLENLMEMEFTGQQFNHSKKWLKNNNLLPRALIILLAYQINNNQFKMIKDLTFLVKVLAQYKDNNLETT